MNELEKIAKGHSLWLKMVLNMGCNPSMAEDIVQQMYVRIDRLLKEGKNVMYNKESANRFYIYLTLKSMYIDYKRARSKYTFFEIMENDEVDEIYEDPTYYASMDMKEQKAFTKIYNRILNEMDTWNFYNKNLCIAYFTTDLSLDKLSKELNIGRSSIYNTVKGHREIIYEKFREDVEDFYNKDYDKI